MVERPLERLAVGTATVAVTTLALFLLGQFLPSLRGTLLSVGTVPAGMLFGYLWLLTLVAGGALVVSSSRSPVDAGWTALVGAAVGLIVLTTLFVIGFVAPSGPLDPASVKLLPAVAVAVTAGFVAGALAWGLVSTCRWIAALVVPGEADTG